MEKHIDELQSKLEKLQGENQFKTEWLSRISHDLKETFGSILWITQAVEDQTLTKEEFFKLLPRIKVDAKKNLQTLEDTSEWLKIRNPEFKVASSKIVAEELFKDLENTFKEELIAKNIQLQFEGDKNMIFISDCSLVFLLLKKLVHNAIKFSQLNSTIVFTVKKESGKTLLSVADEGIGMSEKHLDTCFSFQNAVFRGTQGEIGVGFGLKIARDIVYLLQGKIELVSHENVGTTILIFLP